jgi:predicted transcriptional regulator
MTIPDDVWKQLKALAKRRGQPVTQLFRQAVLEFIDRQQTSLRKERQ